MFLRHILKDILQFWLKTMLHNTLDIAKIWIILVVLRIKTKFMKQNLLKKWQEIFHWAIQKVTLKITVDNTWEKRKISRWKKNISLIFQIFGNKDDIFLVQCLNYLIYQWYLNFSALPELTSREKRGNFKKSGRLDR